MEKLLKQHFGFEHFRAGQQAVIDTIMSGRSAAAIFPTGSGKSLCYQLPALCLPHLTLIVSPLLALIQDQLTFLASKGIPAASIDSTQTPEEAARVMQGIKLGEIKILMISVERFNNERFREFIGNIPVSLLVVDEAHCISEWGHNFRPDYLKLPRYQRELGIPQTLLLTATATTKVIEDMGHKFAIAPADITTTGFYRANLNLHVKGTKESDKESVLVEWIAARTNQSGIVYVTLQQTAELVAKALRGANINATAYHAGMDNERRQSIQGAFMTGECPVIVATIAFGMGVDKSDIRFVVHYDLPKSIENYAQEIGRAGRDGQASDCLVLANTDNLNVLQNFVYGDTPEKSAIADVLADIACAASSGSRWEIMFNSLSAKTNIRILSLKTLLVYLEMLGLIKPTLSYFAEYRFKLLIDEKQLVAKFDAERGQFISAILASSAKAKIWYTLDFGALNQVYPSDRGRVVAAINYFEEQGLIELQTKQMTQVYEVLAQHIDVESLSAQLYQKFIDKEVSEIARIDAMIAMLASKTCLTRALSNYFADHQLTHNCGHCSVCLSGQAFLPRSTQLTPLPSLDFKPTCAALIERLGSAASNTLLTRALCGLTTPIFTKLRLRQTSGFGLLERYPFSEVRDWVTVHRCDVN
ncbi:ATP-dependent DNA helicase RecQ [Shewanella colwelliana]|uniref:RecQ family ATP-dependent DNA helicase n=1 Tax=Shewanella colwelliana TaxID=23 RepID=UPI0022AFD0F8|nr:RecQ family ATP-dependent DNA helicase [Shewanella colwelliana]MCZ4338116.1 RecQ family ATP-dependent DNA helicase [Shewanella colwelliana]